MSKNDESTIDMEREATEARRLTVRKLLGAGGLAAASHLGAGAWVKPVVNAVALPAHAQTSPVEVRFDDSVDDPCFITLTCTEFTAFDVQVDGAVEPPIPGVTVQIEIAFSGSGTFSPFATTVTDSNGEYQASNSYSSNFATSVEVAVTLPDFPEAGTASCSIDTNDTDSLNPGRFITTNPGDMYFCTTYTIGP